MKHVFVINPTAGKGIDSVSLQMKIKNACESKNLDYEVFLTDSKGSGEKFVREFCARGEPARFYACGGDGTLREVTNGAYGAENVSVGCIPLGTGNDFVKAFKKHDFNNIETALTATEKKIDLLLINEKSYCINLCNIGFDADVAHNVSRFKRFFSGILAYNFSVFYCLVGKISRTMEIHIDGEILKGEFLLCACGNGNAYGGGYISAPLAQVDDGLIDVCILKKVSKLKFINLINVYKAGMHLIEPSLKDVITYKKCKRITLAFPKETIFCMDGEIEHAKTVDIQILPKALTFLVP